MIIEKVLTCPKCGKEWTAKQEKVNNFLSGASAFLYLDMNDIYCPAGCKDNEGYALEAKGEEWE